MVRSKFGCLKSKLVIILVFLVKIVQFYEKIIIKKKINFHRLIANCFQEISVIIILIIIVSVLVCQRAAGGGRRNKKN